MPWFNLVSNQCVHECGCLSLENLGLGGTLVGTVATLSAAAVVTEQSSFILPAAAMYPKTIGANHLLYFFLTTRYVFCTSLKTQDGTHTHTHTHALMLISSLCSTKEYKWDGEGALVGVL
jgi:hypothetical protein